MSEWMSAARKLRNEEAMPMDEWLLQELYYAFLDARKHKRTTGDEFCFEANLMGNLMKLRDAILDGNYRPSRGIAFITFEPVIREIFAAPFQDRIVHHFLYNMCADWWDNRLIYDSYSCRIGKGTLMGINRLDHHMRSVSRNYQEPAYIIKLDIKSYFTSLPRKKLMERVVWGLERQFVDNEPMYDLLRYLWAQIIFDNPVKGVRRRGPKSDWDKLPKEKSLFNQKPGYGIVIGNLSSQLLSNIYLDSMDRMIKYDLGYRHYGRYVDDFYIVVTEAEYGRALEDIRVIEDYLLNEKELILHPNKRYIQDVRHGVEFLGVMIHPGFRVPGRRFREHFYRAAEEVATGAGDSSSIISYLGYLKHMDGKKFAKKVFDKYGWEYRF